MKTIPRLEIDGGRYAGADLHICKNSGYSAEKRPFIIVLAGYGIEATRELTVDDLVTIHEWIDSSLTSYRESTNVKA